MGDDTWLTLAGINQLAQAAGGVQVPSDALVTLQVTVTNQGQSATTGGFTSAPLSCSSAYAASTSGHPKKRPVSR